MTQETEHLEVKKPARAKRGQSDMEALRVQIDAKVKRLDELAKEAKTVEDERRALVEELYTMQEEASADCDLSAHSRNITKILREGRTPEMDAVNGQLRRMQHQVANMIPAKPNN